MYVFGIIILNIIIKYVLYRNVYCVISGYKLYLWCVSYMYSLNISIDLNCFFMFFIDIFLSVNKI